MSKPIPKYLDDFDTGIDIDVNCDRGVVAALVALIAILAVSATILYFVGRFLMTLTGVVR